MSSERNPVLDPEGALPRVPGWLSLTEAGQRLGISRQYAYNLAKRGHFKTLARLGSAHIFCVSAQEVDELVEEGAPNE